MALKLITAPATTPVSLTEAKAHLRVDHTDDDTLITACIAAATAYVDGPNGWLGRALIEQTWELTIDEFPDNEIKIPMPPLIEVVSIKYDDTAGDEQTLSTDDYTVDLVSEPGWVLPDDTWPSTFDGINAVRIRFRAGYTGGVPADIKAAILLYIGTLYEHRETVIVGQAATQLPWAAEALLRRKKIHLGLA